MVGERTLVLLRIGGSEGRGGGGGGETGQFKVDWAVNSKTVQDTTKF